MTIRRTLLIAFLLVGLLPAAALTVLAFDRTRAAMVGEIGQSLAVTAGTVSTDIDTLMFERLQNATTWNHLEVMQDLLIGDVDKRLSAFLAEMKLRYGGVYRDLHVVDPQGRIVASSRAEAIGTRQPNPPAWQTARLPGGVVRLEAPLPDAAGSRLTIRSAIASQFEDRSLGELVLVMDWEAVQRLLDTSAGSRLSLALIDGNGRLIAHSLPPQRWSAPPLGTQLDAWRATSTEPASEIREGQPLLPGRVLAARALSGGYDAFAGFAWTTVTLAPVSDALAPVRRMALVFLGLLLASAAIIAAAASVVSRRIAQPIMALTAYTRSFMNEQRLPEPPEHSGSGEVAELSNTFVHMVESLDRSRETLIRASKLAAVGEMAAVMAHEIRTPLGILRSSAQMLRREDGISEENRELLGFIDSETERLNRIVMSMLDTARARPPQRLPLDVNALATRTVAMLAAQAKRQGIALLTRLDAQSAWIEGDAEQLTQVLLNLIVNALQILPAGGRIEISTQNDGHRLLLEVADNGPGIPEDERHRIFEPFVFRREGGLGLGLAVVKQIVGAHAGDIAIVDNAGGGARFRLRFPVLQEPS
jgi:signal transduction histidine kinase